MSHRKEEIEEFLDILATTPFVSHACKKAGISKATIYRWMEADPRFKKKALQALADGRKNLIDVAEIALVGKIKESDMNAIKYFLSHNSKRYKPQLSVRQQEFEIDGRRMTLEQWMDFIKSTLAQQRPRQR